MAKPKPRKFGTCGCGHIIKLQRDHNDPTIWECIACERSVCDWCYHVHHEAKHGARAKGRENKKA